jgi:hypothetical protein
MRISPGTYVLLTCFVNSTGDVATASLIETWVDEDERRTWFLSEVVGV